MNLEEYYEEKLEFKDALITSFQLENQRLTQENKDLREKLAELANHKSVENALLRRQIKDWQEVKRIMGVED